MTQPSPILESLSSLRKAAMAEGVSDPFRLGEVLESLNQCARAAQRVIGAKALMRDLAELFSKVPSLGSVSILFESNATIEDGQEMAQHCFDITVLDAQGITGSGLTSPEGLHALNHEVTLHMLEHGAGAGYLRELAGRPAHQNVRYSINLAREDIEVPGFAQSGVPDQLLWLLFSRIMPLEARDIDAGFASPSEARVDDARSHWARDRQSA